MSVIKYEIENKVAVIQMNRPEALNALSYDLQKELNDAIQTALNDEEVSVIVLGGEGKSFCAGGDVKNQANRVNDAEQNYKRLSNSYKLIEELYYSPKPIITAVQGYAVGAGLGIALRGDLIVASTDAKFMVPFLRIGLVADAGFSYLAARRIGTERTKRLLLTGERIDAETAERWGMVDWVVEPSELRSKALELAHQLAESPLTAMGMNKLMMNNIAELGFKAALGQEISNQTLCFSTTEHKERVTALVQGLDRK